MSDPLPSPGPTPPPEAAAQSAVVRQAAGFCVVLLLALIGWRWWNDHQRHRPLPLKRSTVQIDLNKATKSELMQLPGIGPGLADRIVRERELGGSFRDADDLRRVQGFGPSTIDQLRPWVKTSPTTEPASTEPDRLIRKSTPATNTPKTAAGGVVRINSATLDELNTLPGIGPVLAQRIIDERNRKPFESVQDLRRISGIGPKRLEQLKDVVRFD